MQMFLIMIKICVYVAILVHLNEIERGSVENPLRVDNNQTR